MGRLDRIENLAISGTATHNNLRLIMRGKPLFVDPQLLNGVTRFSYIRGSQFSALFPSNQSPLATNAYIGGAEVVLTNHPTWMSENTLVRIGSNERIGELAIVKDVQNDTTVVLSSPLISDYIVDETQTGNIPVATLMGTPCSIYEIPSVSFLASYAENALRVEVIAPPPPPPEFLDHSGISSRVGNKISGLGIQENSVITGIEVELTVSSLDIVEIKKSEAFIVVYTTQEHTFKKGIPVVINNSSAAIVNGSWTVTEVFSSTSFSIDAPITILNLVVGQKSVGGFVVEATVDAPYILSSGDTRVSIIGSRAKDSNVITLSQSFPDYLLDTTIVASGSGLPVGALVTGIKYFATLSLETTDASAIPVSIMTLEDNRYLVLESWWPLVQSDVLLMSRTPAVLTSLVKYPIANVVPAGTRSGEHIAGEPETVYRFVVSLATKTGLLPFVPSLGDLLFLRAQPLYYTRDFGVGDVSIPETQGPFLFDAYFGSMISEYKIDTKLGIKLWDGFGTQIGEGWTEIEPNHLVLERPILSESLLFWQRIEGNFQYKKDRFFQAELSERGRFTMSSDLLVPKWPTDKQRSWVIPIKSPVAVRMIIQFEPQPPMVVEIPADTLTYVKPVILEGDSPIDRILVSFSGDAGTRVEIQDWRYDGEIPRSFSYYIMGTGECYGNGKWLAGGFSIKPLFYSLSCLKARYSDTVSRYNAGYLYR